MGIIDSKNLLTVTESIKPKATKPYSKRKKNPFAKQFKLTDRNAPENKETDVLKSSKSVSTGRKVLTDKRGPVLYDRKPFLTDNRQSGKKPVLTTTDRVKRSPCLPTTDRAKRNLY